MPNVPQDESMCVYWALVFCDCIRSHRLFDQSVSMSMSREEMSSFPMFLVYPLEVDK